MLPFLPLIGSVVKGGIDLFKNRQDRKKLVAEAKAELQKKKVDNTHEVALTDAQWEALAAEDLDKSWKDELVTVVLMAPIACILIGGVWAGFTGNDKLLQGTLIGIDALKELGFDYEFLTKAVVLAAIGLKVWRS